MQNDMIIKMVDRYTVLFLAHRLQSSTTWQNKESINFTDVYFMAKDVEDYGQAHNSLKPELIV